MHAHAMTDEEKACTTRLTPEYDRIHEIWKELGRRIEAELDKDTRIPLAIDATVKGFAKELHEKAHKDHEDISKALTQYIQSLIELGVYMFRLGQACALHANPIRYEDLGFCNCGKLTDADIAKLLTPPTPPTQRPPTE